MARVMCMISKGPASVVIYPRLFTWRARRPVSNPYPGGPYIARTYNVSFTPNRRPLTSRARVAAYT